MTKMKANWAELTREGFDGIAEYLAYAVEKFPDKELLDKYELSEHLKIHAHLFVCIKTLLMHTDEEYRNKALAAVKESESGSDNPYMY